MPGKTPANRGGKESSNSTGELGTEKTKKYSIWPKWTDDEPATDKKEAGKQSSADGSRLRKGTALSSEHIDSGKANEEDFLPPSLSSDDIMWVNPGTYITEPRIPVIVAEPIPSNIDLISENGHLMKSELMCSIISQLQALWQVQDKPSLAKEGADGENKEWQPWDHIQHRKEHLVPMLNPLGKYGVKIYWMGAWRKITVTDQIPLRPIDKCSIHESPTEEDGEKKEAKKELDKEVLLPRTANTSELWPAILTKAILKVAALDYRRGQYEREFGDCNVIHMLTGWYPQSLPTRLESDVLWKALCQLLPRWERPPGEEEGDDRVLSEEGEGNQDDGDCHEVKEEAQEVVNDDKMDGIVTAQFLSACNGKHMTRAKETLMNQSLEILRKRKLVPQHYDPLHDHANPMLIRQVRDVPLKLPPKERPPKPAPEEHAWLGYSHRRYEPWKDPPPKPLPPRWVEVVSPYCISLGVRDVEKENEPPQSVAQSPGGSPPVDDTVPITTSGELEEDGNDHDSKKESESVNEDGSDDETEVTDGVWMKYEDFRKAFSAVELFTPNTNFKYTHSYKDLTAIVENVPEEPKGKGRASHSPATKVLKTVDTVMADDTNILFLEQNDEENDRKPTELHFVLTCLSNWREGSKNMKTERKKSVALKRRRTSILDSHNRLSNFRFSVPAQALSSSSYAWGGGIRPSTIPEADEEDSTAGSQVAIIPPPTLPPTDEMVADDERVIPGSLVVEEFDWKSIETKLPLLRIISTGVKGAVMKLDGSQRIFKLHVKAPLGYHLNISSNRPFELTNEDTAYNRMHREGIGFSKVYSGSISPLQPNSWAVVFREVLHVRKVDQFLAFSLNCPVPGHLLRVVDNDVCLEIPRVAHITKPQQYSPNKNGYTILCEMWTKSEPVAEGNNWRLRVISSDKDLPLCEGLEKEEDEEESGEDGECDGEGEVVSEKEEEEGKEKKEVVEVKIEREFYHREIRDYCLPDRDNVMLRYTLKVTKDCPITIQLSTSKKDAYIKLELYDGSSLVAVTQGRAYCFIPSYQLNSVDQSQFETTLDTHPVSNVHKYLLMATIIQDSWPLADTAWTCIADIRAAEEEKANTVSGGGGGGGKGKKPPSASSKGGGKGKKGKGGTKDGGGKEGGDGVQSSSSLSSIDICKPHWTLRVALRQSDKEHFEICKDTEKDDELRSMQAAWETQQPGRVKKGQESRQKFLDSHALKDTTDQQLTSTTPSTTSISSSVAQLTTTPSTTPYSSLQPPTGPVPLHRIDLSLYTKYSNSTPHVLTAEEREQRDEEKREIIRQYRAWRHSILQSRDQDRQFRNEEKLRQLEEAEKLQTELELTRKRMNRGREKIRQCYLAEEKARIEAEQAALKAAEAETAANARDSKAKGKKGKKK